MPNTAFKGNAGTDVTTDILFLQKRSSGVREEGERWKELAPIDTPEGNSRSTSISFGILR
ncbi:MAG TPA: hypothetical protein VNH18_26695 [Bryobacteraceae bacterium]|nr:hypothetical protein [Bryobacteraceae bacterium]